METMHKLIASIFAASLFLWLGQSAGCFLTKGPVTPAGADGGMVDASPGAKFVDCSDEALRAAGASILPDVETDVALTPAASAAALEGLLVTLAAQVGGPLALAELSCAIQYAVNEAKAHLMKAPSDSIEPRKVYNGNAFLARHQVTLVGLPQ